MDINSEVLNDLKKGQSCSLYGNRRTGKTTFALMIKKELKKLGFKVVYIDCGLICKQIDLWRMIIDKFSLNYSSKSVDIDYYEFVKALENDNSRKVLILDEFELLVSNPNITVDVFNFLRGLANPEINLIYMTISAKSISNLMNKDIRFIGSPFFNIFAEYPI